MKKRYTTLLVLLLATVLCFGGVSLLNASQQQEESSSDETPSLLGIEETSISAIVWDTADGAQMRLEQTVSKTTDEDGNEVAEVVWTYPQNSALPLDQTVAEDLAQTLTTLTPERTLTDAGQLSEYGLDAPTAEITVETAQGSMVLQIGSQNETTMDYYAKLKDSDTVYTISENPADSLPASESALIEIESLTYISMSSVTKAELSTPQGQLVLQQVEVQPEETAASSESSSDTAETSSSDSTAASSESSSTETAEPTMEWQASLNGQVLTTDQDSAEAIIRDILALSYEQCVDYAPQSLADYGLEPALYTLTLTYNDGEADQTFTLYLGNQQADGSVCAFQMGGTQVGAVSASNYQLLLDAIAAVIAQ